MTGKYWDDFKKIIDSPKFGLVEKNEAILKLNYFVIYDLETETFIFKDEIINEIDAFIQKHNPNLLAILERELKELKCWRDFEKLAIVPLDFIVYLILVIILTCSYKGSSIRYTILIVHFVNLVSSLFHKDCLQHGFIVEDVEKLINDSIHSCIRNDIVKSIGVRNFDKFEKNILRVIRAVLDKLIDLEFLTIRKEKNLITYKTDGTIENIKRRKHAMRILKLNVPLIETNILNFMSNNWPSLAPLKVTPETPVYTNFKKGEFKVIPTEKLLRSLNAVGKVGVKYDWNLFLEARENISSSNFFYYNKKYNLQEVGSKKILNDLLLSECKMTIKSQYVLEKYKLICFYNYLKKYNLTLEIWFVELALKRGKENRLSEKDAFVFYKRFYEKNKGIIEVLIPNLILFIIDAFNRDFYDYTDILNLYLEVDLNSIDGISDEDYDVLNKVRNLIVLIFRELGLKEIVNFSLIFDCFIQKKYPFMQLWNEYQSNELFRTDSLLNKKNVFEKDARYWTGVESHLMEMEFKSETMYLFRNHKIYFLPQIGINSRHVYSHYVVHPLSGNLFRFAKTTPEQLTQRGLLHLKRAMLCQLNISFKSLEELDKLVNEMDMIELEKIKYDSIGVFCFYDALKKAQDNLPCDVFVRIDECGSGLTYQGVLSGCKYLQRITNLTDPKIKYEPYSSISNDYFKPAFEEFLNKWKNNREFISDETNKSLYSLIEKTIGLALDEKKFVKYVIMPHTYNLTNEGVKAKILDLLKEKHPEENWKLLNESPFLKSLSLKIWHAVFKASPKLKRFRDILNTTQKFIIVFIGLLLKYDKNVYTTVLKNYDHISMWDYKEKRYVEKKKVWIPKLNYSDTVKVLVNTSKTAKDECLRAFLPLLTQTRDSDIIRLSTDICVNDLNFDVMSSHDAIACHPNNLDEAHKALKRAFYLIFKEGKVTNKRYLEDLWLNPTLAQTTNVLRNMEKDIIKERNNKAPSRIDIQFRKLIFGDKREEIDEIVKDIEKSIICVNSLLELKEEKYFQELNRKFIGCLRLEIKNIYSRNKKKDSHKKGKKGAKWWEVVEKNMFKCKNKISVLVDTEILDVHLKKIENNFKKIDDIGEDILFRLSCRIEEEGNVKIQHNRLKEKKKIYLEVVKKYSRLLKTGLQDEKSEKLRDSVKKAGRELHDKFNDCNEKLKTISEYKLEKNLIKEELKFIRVICEDTLLSLKQEIKWTLNYKIKMENVMHNAIEIKCSSAIVKNKWNFMWSKELKENKRVGFCEEILNVKSIFDNPYHYFYE